MGDGRDQEVIGLGAVAECGEAVPDFVTKPVTGAHPGVPGVVGEAGGECFWTS